MRRGELESSFSNGWTAGEEVPMLPESTEEGLPGGAWNSRPVPGRPRRSVRPLHIPKPKRKSSFCHRFYVRWFHGAAYSVLVLAVGLWFLLGVVSIATSKWLLMPPVPGTVVGNVPPLFLTLQQLILGSSLLRFLLYVRALGSAGLQPWPSPSAAVTTNHRSSRRSKSSFRNSKDLLAAGVFFALGFLATNYSFQQSSAAFVETIKAAEPITSAAVAVLWGIESLGAPEVLSLAAIVAGVLCSTLGSSGESESMPSVSESMHSCLVIMTANLCFSFRGLHQKLFRALPHGTASVIDDLNLQFRMQQIGVATLCLPVLLWDMPGIVARLWNISFTVGLFRSGAVLKYMGLALLNGLAFASYNLASTYVLTRVSVVHHAALNCIRRIFAIVVTSITFGIPITLLGAFGIVVSFCGFLSFTHHKAKRQRQPRPLSSLLPMSAV